MNKGVKMKIDAKDFRVPAGNKVDLEKWPTLVKPVYKSKKQYAKLLQGTRRGVKLRCSAFTTLPTAMRCC